MMIWWPNSPATPKRPRSSRPSMTMAPPIPVPRVMQTRRFCALPGAEAPFRPGGGIGVVGQQHRPAEQPLQVVPQRLVAPGQVRAEQHGAAVEVHPAGRADARPTRSGGPAPSSSTSSTMTCSTARGSLPGVDRRAWAEDPALGIDHAGRHLGAADVDADGEALAAQPQVLTEALPGRSGGRGPPGVRRRQAAVLRQGPGCSSGWWCVHGSPFYVGPRSRPGTGRVATSSGRRRRPATAKLLASRCRRTHMPWTAY